MQQVSPSKVRKKLIIQHIVRNMIRIDQKNWAARQDMQVKFSWRLSWYQACISWLPSRFSSDWQSSKRAYLSLTSLQNSPPRNPLINACSVLDSGCFFFSFCWEAQAAAARAVPDDHMEGRRGVFSLLPPEVVENIHNSPVPPLAEMVLTETQDMMCRCYTEPIMSTMPVRRNANKGQHPHDTSFQPISSCQDESWDWSLRSHFVIIWPFCVCVWEWEWEREL